MRVERVEEVARQAKETAQQAEEDRLACMMRARQLKERNLQNKKTLEAAGKRDPIRRRDPLIDMDRVELTLMLGRSVPPGLDRLYQQTVQRRARELDDRGDTPKALVQAREYGLKSGHARWCDLAPVCTRGTLFLGLRILATSISAGTRKGPTSPIVRPDRRSPPSPLTGPPAVTTAMAAGERAAASAHHVRHCHQQRRVRRSRRLSPDRHLTGISSQDYRGPKLPLASMLGVAPVAAANLARRTPGFLTDRTRRIQ